MARATEGLPEGYRLVVLDRVDSTNAEALRRAAAGEAGGLWVVARVQTAGRGRRGRGWASPPGNLHASLLIEADWPVARSGEIAFAAGLALRDAIASFADVPARVALKWPNDLLIDGDKAAGLLLEAVPASNGRHHLVVGIGVNCDSHPDDAPYPATDLKAAGIVATADDLFPRLSARLAHWLGRWKAQGFQPLREAWLAVAAGLGRPIVARLPDRDLTGVFQSIDPEGRLVIADGTGALPPIPAADVFFPALAAAGAERD